MNDSTDSKSDLRPGANLDLKKLATWGVVIGTALWTAFFFGFLIVSATLPDSVADSWFLRMLQQHPSGTLGIAISAISAFSVVAVLDVLSRDPIEIKFLGFELKGAAGPVVLWVVCFLAMVAGTEVLWGNAGI
jgi:hypothetical protein